MGNKTNNPLYMIYIHSNDAVFNGISSDGDG